MKLKKFLCITLATMTLMSTNVFANEEIIYLYDNEMVLNNETSDTEDSLIEIEQGEEKLTTTPVFRKIVDMATGNFNFAGGSAGSSSIELRSWDQFTNFTEGTMTVNTLAEKGNAKIQFYVKGSLIDVTDMYVIVPSGVNRTYSLKGFDPNKKYYIRVSGNYYIDGSISN